MVVTGYFSQQVRRAFHALPPITISDPDLTLIESATAGGKRPSTVLHAELTHCTAISFKTSSEWQRVGSMELAFLDGVDEEKKTADTWHDNNKSIHCQHWCKHLQFTFIVDIYFQQSPASKKLPGPQFALRYLIMNMKNATRHKNRPNLPFTALSAPTSTLMQHRGAQGASL